MPSKIRVLTEHTINKIAAGEVIENPSSVIKELVENSIDAGATEISIEIKGGGRQLIRITDNGCGMNKDDALLCLERHATSKIKEVEDIHSIITMGFRGEAIPSIASISKFTLLTCPRAEENSPEIPQGTLLIVEGGKILQCCDAVRSPGTTIEVKSLFFNIPVRKKFQKSPANDVNDILKMLSVISLGHPHIKFELINNQETLLTTSLNDLELQEQLGRRIHEVLGKEFFSDMISINEMWDEYHLQGYIGQPIHAKHNRTGQYLFINARPIFSPLISFSIRQGYGTMLSANKHPIYVLHLTMPGHLVDVNVHPQKREVRLRQEQTLKEMIIRAIEKSLNQSSLSFEEPFNRFEVKEILEQKNENEHFDFKKAFEINLQEDLSPPSNFVPIENSSNLIDKLSKRTPDTVKAPAMMIESFCDTKSLQNPPLFAFEQPKKIVKVLGTILGYILLEANSINGIGAKEGLILVDQRAAHSRIIFERFLEQDGTRQAVQTLLIPYTWESSPLEAMNFRLHLEKLNQMGISIQEIGPHSFMIDAIPQVFGNTDLKALIAEITHRMGDLQDSKEFENEMIKQLTISASRAAVSGNKRLSIEEAQSIIDRLLICKNSSQCPQGKPIMSLLNYDELGKIFLKNSL